MQFVSGMPVAFVAGNDAKASTANPGIRGDHTPVQSAKQILDCSSSEFFRMLKYKKGAEAGRRIEEIDPRYTSQQCSLCGFVSKDN
jgi:hypothetical protein